MARRVDGGWQNGAAGDWQLLTLECSIRLDTAESCLEDTDALLLQVCAGYVRERRASVARSVADGSSRGRTQYRDVALISSQEKVVVHLRHGSLSAVVLMIGYNGHDV